MSIRDYINEAFASKAIPPDPPGMPPRSNQYQIPSDRLREKAADFARLVVALVPVPAFHEPMVDVLHDVVVGGESALQELLEGSDELKREGRTLGCQHAPLRVFTDEIGRLRADLERLRAENERLIAANAEHKLNVEPDGSTEEEAAPTEPQAAEPGQPAEGEPAAAAAAEQPAADKPAKRKR